MCFRIEPSSLFVQLKDLSNQEVEAVIPRDVADVPIPGDWLHALQAHISNTAKFCWRQLGIEDKPKTAMNGPRILRLTVEQFKSVATGCKCYQHYLIYDDDGERR